MTTPDGVGSRERKVHRAQGVEREVLGTQLRLGTMDELLDLVSRSKRALVVVSLPETTIVTVNAACVELFGDTMAASIGRHAGSLFHGADQVLSHIALAALAAGTIDSFSARWRLAGRTDVEAWTCVRTLDMEGVHLALGMAVPVDQPRPREGIEEVLATAAEMRWASPPDPIGPRNPPRLPNDMDGPYAVLERLPPRQREIVAALLQGERIAAIAASQFVSASTVRSQLSAIYKAFSVRSQTELLSLLRPGNTSSAGPGRPKR